MFARDYGFLPMIGLVFTLACGDSSGAGAGTQGGGGSIENAGGGGSAVVTGGLGGGLTEGGGGFGGSSDSSSSSGVVDPCAGLPVVSFATDVQPILTTSCAKANCHSGVMPDAGLDLTVGHSHAELVGVATAQCGGQRTRVVASDPSGSYLVDKIMGQELCGNSVRMPPSPSASLSQEKKDIILGWVCRGAVDD
ncbi:MAG: PE-PGRS family protein [Polyangiaceae bacterium]